MLNHFSIKRHPIAKLKLPYHITRTGFFSDGAAPTVFLCSHCPRLLHKSLDNPRTPALLPSFLPTSSPALPLQLQKRSNNLIRGSEPTEEGEKSKPIFRAVDNDAALHHAIRIRKSRKNTYSSIKKALRSSAIVVVRPTY